MKKSSKGGSRKGARRPPVQEAGESTPRPRVRGEDLPKWVFAEHMKTSEDARGPALPPGPYDESEYQANDFPDESSALIRAVAANDVCDPVRGELESAAFDPEERSAELHLRGASRIGKGAAGQDTNHEKK